MRVTGTSGRREGGFGGKNRYVLSPTRCQSVLPPVATPSSVQCDGSCSTSRLFATPPVSSLLCPMNAVACFSPPIPLQIKTEVFQTGYAVVHMSSGASILGRMSLCMISVLPLGAEERKWIQARDCLLAYHCQPRRCNKEAKKRSFNRVQDARKYSQERHKRKACAT